MKALITSPLNDQVSELVNQYDAVCIRVSEYMKQHYYYEAELAYNRLGMSRGTYFKRLKYANWTIDELRKFNEVFDKRNW